MNSKPAGKCGRWAATGNLETQARGQVGQVWQSQKVRWQRQIFLRKTHSINTNSNLCKRSLIGEKNKTFETQAVS